VADEKNQFFRAPIGHPALGIVPRDGQELYTEESNPGDRDNGRPATHRFETPIGGICLVSKPAVRKPTAQLLEDDR
jgi:hypothetical protein